MALLLFGSALGLNGILSIERLTDRSGFLADLPWTSPIVLGFSALLGLLVYAFYKTPFRYWLYCVIVLIPIEVSVPIGPFPTLSPIDYVAAASFIALCFRLGAKRFAINVFDAFPRVSFVAFSLFIVYGCLMAIYLGGSPRGTFRWGEFLYFYAMATIALQNEDPEHVQSVICLILCATSAVVSGIAILQFAQSGGHAAEAHATLGHRNIMAAFLSLSLPAVSAFNDTHQDPGHPLRRAALFLTICGLVMSYSRGAWIGLAVGVGFVLYKLKQDESVRAPNLKNALLIILVLIGPLSILLLLGNPEKGIFSTSQRPIYWGAANNILKKHPLVGLGPGNYDARIRDYLSPAGQEVYRFDMREKHKVDFWQHLHNLYLQVAVEYGILGLILWLEGIFFLVYSAHTKAMADPHSLKPYFLMSIIAFLVHNMVDITTVSSLDILFVFLITFCQSSRTP